MGTHLLTSERPVKKRPLPILSIDFENDITKGAVSGFQCASIYGYTNIRVGRAQTYQPLFHEKTFTELDTLFEYLLNINTQPTRVPGILSAFNYNYDMNFLFEILDDPHTLQNKSTFISAQTTNGFKMYDVANYAQGSLKDWIQTLNMEELYGVVKVEDEEGNMPTDMNEIKRRCANDAKATYFLTKYFSDFCFDWGVSFKATAPSAALSIFRTNFFHHRFVRKDDVFNDYERHSYYGARTELFRRGVFDVKSYDINSQYPWVMRDKEFPDPASIQYFDNGVGWGRTLDDENTHAIFNVRVKAPKNFVMTLPYKHNVGTSEEKLLFPWGEFTGCWTSVELREALKDGYEIVHCYNYVKYRHSYPYFREFVDTFYRLRREAEEDGRRDLAQVYKRMLNSLYGKFAQRNGKNGFLGKMSGFLGDLPNGVNIKVFDFCGNDIISIAATIEEDAKHTFPVLSSFVTAYARLELKRLMNKYEDYLIYSDTDSLKLMSNVGHVPTDKRLLGALKDETNEMGGRMAFIRVKNYFPVGDAILEIPFEEDADISGMPDEIVIPRDRRRTIKGVGKKDDVVFSVIDRVIRSHGLKPIRTKEGIRMSQEPGKWIDKAKESDIYDSKRVWSGKQSEPIYINEFARKVA